MKVFYSALIPASNCAQSYCASCFLYNILGRCLNFLVTLIIKSLVQLKNLNLNFDFNLLSSPCTRLIWVGVAWSDSIAYPAPLSVHSFPST